MKNEINSKPEFDGILNYCTRCCTPETNEGMEFDELGICKACRSSEQKMHIDWKAKKEELIKILEGFRTNDNYDCIVPISGGKDSAYQLHLVKKEFNLNPLAVTFSHNLYTKTGRYNLKNILEKLDIDHIEYTPKRSLVNRMMKKSLYAIGDSCWHCHAGVGSFPLHIACNFNIPLVIYGESPAEHSGRTTYKDIPKLYDIDHFIKNSAKVQPQNFIKNTNISSNEISMFLSPHIEKAKKLNLSFLYLGDYIFWDAEFFTEFIVDQYGWKEDIVEGTYKRYKSVECKMPGVHDYTKYLKRGFGRGTDFASQDVRAGIITREEGFELAKQYDSVEPDILQYYLESTGISRKEFYDTMSDLRESISKGLPPLKYPKKNE